MAERGTDRLEFKDLGDGLTTVVTIRETCLADEAVTPLKAELRDGLIGRIDDGRRFFVFNLGRLVMVDSCGLAAIISMKRLLESHDAEIALTDVSDLLLRLFHLTRLDRVIAIHSTEAEALSGYRGERTCGS